ncbi:MAG: hypothetical protein J7K53_14165 [Bacteroidales bacterium]|nr:hypothetical protein [Bacteroidales bacterium]
MEDGTSSILYIIITAIIILVGVLGKKKNPKQIPGGSGNGETGGMDFFEKLGLTDTDESKEESFDIQKEKTTETAEREQYGSIITSTLEDQSDKKAEPTEKVFEEETEEVNPFSEIPDEFDSDMNEIKDEFDLKKAIIYSEIINKKYE